MSEIDESKAQPEETIGSKKNELVIKESVPEEEGVNLESEEIRKYKFIFPNTRYKMMNTLSLPLMLSEDNRFCNTDKFINKH